MRILLLSIDAKYIHTNNAIRLLQANCDFPVEIKEYTIKDSISEMVRYIESSKPDVLGLSVYIWNVEIVQSLLQHLPASMTVILGGPEVSYDPEYFLSFDQVSYVIRGEGELAFNQLIHCLHHDEPIDSIPNLAFIDNGTIYTNPIEEIKELSALEAPYYRNEDIDHIAHRISYIESSRGCPYNCSYCLSSLEKTVRFFPLESVTKAIQYLMDNGAKTIKFLDRTFNANRHTLAILDYIIKHDNHQTTFQFEITGDVLKQDIIDYIHARARAGLFRFEIGIQSTNDETNRLVDRNQNTTVLFDRIRQIQKQGVIDLHLDLIAGLPGEDKESFIQTFNEVFLLGAKEVQLGFLKMLRGTKIRREADRFSYQFSTSSPYEIQSNHVLSEDDIKEIKLVEHMLELYHNKGYFGQHLHEIIVQSPSPYHFFLEIGHHYQSNQYDMHRYQLKDIYQRLLERLNEKQTYLILQDYLTRSRIKPERFFGDKIPKSIRNDILNRIATEYSIPLHKLFKHSVLINYQDEFFCAYYKDNYCQTYTIKST